MKYSLMTEPHLGGTYQQQLDAALWAEAEGLTSFARSDHYISNFQPTPDGTDAFATLAGLARDTSSIRLCVLVSPITFRHPAVILKNAVTIDQMSGGRLDLGVGTGWMELEHKTFGMPFPSWSERFQRLEETLDYLSAAFGPDPVAYEGQHYQISGNIQPKPEGIRLVVGGSGPKRTPTLAATGADEYNIFYCLPDEVRAKVAAMRSAAGDRQVEVTMMGGAVVGRTQAAYEAELARVAASSGATPEDLEARLKARGLPIGTPAQVAETMTALEEAGVERYYIQWIDLDDPDGMKETVDILRA